MRCAGTSACLAAIASLCTAILPPSPAGADSPDFQAGQAPRVATALAKDPTDPASAEADRRPVEILFLGDLMFHRRQHGAAKASGLPDAQAWRLPFREMEPRFARADLVVGNLECPVTGREHSYYPSFNAPPGYLEGLAAAGIRVLNTSNNHAFDQGKAGAEATLRAARNLGITVLGGAETVVTEVRGVRIAFLAFTEFSNNGGRYLPDSPITIVPRESVEGRHGLVRRVAEARAKADVVVVIAHWGWEMHAQVLPWQQQWAGELLAAGADLIVGHHPHVAGPVEVREAGARRGIVAYSLGNFAAGMHEPGAGLGLMLAVRIQTLPDRSSPLLSAGSEWVWTQRFDRTLWRWVYRVVDADRVLAECAGGSATLGLVRDECLAFRESWDRAPRGSPSRLEIVPPADAFWPGFCTSVPGENEPP